jgi:hypothetical protein
VERRWHPMFECTPSTSPLWRTSIAGAIRGAVRNRLSASSFYYAKWWANCCSWMAIVGPLLDAMPSGWWAIAAPPAISTAPAASTIPGPVNESPCRLTLCKVAGWWAIATPVNHGHVAFFFTSCRLACTIDSLELHGEEELIQYVFLMRHTS